MNSYMWIFFQKFLHKKHRFRVSDRNWTTRTVIIFKTVCSITISFASKFKLYKSLVTSILLYGCETWTLLADCGKKKGSRPSKPSA